MQHSSWNTNGIKRLQKKLFIYLTFFVVFLISGISYAESKEGFFLGVGGTHVDIGGDFDGEHFVIGGGSLAALPELDSGTGLKFTAGYQFDIGTFEFSYSKSEHDGTWLGIDTPATFNSYNLDSKIFVFKEFYRIQPLLAFGAAYKRLTVDGGSSDGFSVKDAKFSGWDLRLGGGVELSLHKRVALDLLGIYRWGRYTSVSGIADLIIEDDLEGNGLTASAEVKFIF